MPDLCAGYGSKEAVDKCTFNPTAVNVSSLIELVNGLATYNYIDAVANIAGDKVFIYHGSKDTNILPGINVDTLANKKYSLYAIHWENCTFSYMLTVAYKDSLFVTDWQWRVFILSETNVTIWHTDTDTYLLTRISLRECKILNTWSYEQVWCVQ